MELETYTVTVEYLILSQACTWRTEKAKVAITKGLSSEDQNKAMLAWGREHIDLEDGAVVWAVFDRDSNPEFARHIEDPWFWR